MYAYSYQVHTTQKPSKSEGLSLQHYGDTCTQTLVYHFCPFCHPMHGKPWGLQKLLTYLTSLGEDVSGKLSASPTGVLWTLRGLR